MQKVYFPLRNCGQNLGFMCKELTESVGQMHHTLPLWRKLKSSVYRKWKFLVQPDPAVNVGCVTLMAQMTVAIYLGSYLSSWTSTLGKCTRSCQSPCANSELGHVEYLGQTSADLLPVFHTFQVFRGPFKCVTNLQ